MTSPSRVGVARLSVPALLITAAVALCPTPARAASGVSAQTSNGQASASHVSAANPPRKAKPASVGPTGTPLKPATQNTVSLVSPAPNTFPVGTDYVGTSESVSSTAIFSYGPGNKAGTYSVPGFIEGDFNHCGYIGAGTSTPLQPDLAPQIDPADPSCSALPRGVGGSFLAHFIATFTDGQVFSAGGNGAPITLDLSASGCTPEGYGNVDPWVPQNEVGLDGFPMDPSAAAVATFTWRYVSKSGQFVMIHGPAPGNDPTWYFVDVDCTVGL
jgi:hypothetical protein